MTDNQRDQVTPEPERPGAFTGKSEGKETPLVPKNVRKLATRTLILLLAVAAILFGLQKWRDLRGDLGGVTPADTKGDILALRLLEEGSRAVVLRKDGKLVESAGYGTGQTDRDAAWNPSGNRVLFVSDRKAGETHIYRWNPATNGEPEQKTVDASSRGEIAFPRDVSGGDADNSALVATRGNIEEFFPSESRSLRVLPPTSKEIAVTGGTGDAEGSGGAFQAVYNTFGTSFRSGRWCKGKTMVAAVMRRGEDEGEILLVQSLVANEQGALPRPVPIIAGERIEFDVNPASGDLVISVADFDYFTDEDRRRATKDGKVLRPFRHALLLVDLSDASAPKTVPVAASNGNETAFAAPVISPDGARILVPAGSWADGAVRPQGLIAFPAREGGAAAGSPIRQGEVYEPSWSPAGDRIVYVRREAGRRAIFVAGADGSGETLVSGAAGDFASPKFSPQK